MDNNLLNYGLPQLNLNPFTAQYNLAAINANTLTFQLTPSIDISAGFRSNNNPITLSLSVDQHTLRFYISEQVSSTGAVQYLLKLVGNLYYNVSFVGVEPIDPVITTCGTISFTNNGNYNIDYTVGVFNSIAEIQNLILSNFSITAALDRLSVVNEAGETIVYDPANPQPFYNALSGNENITLYAVFTVIITFSDQPIS